MAYGLQEIKLATCLLYVLGITLVVAVVAFFVRRRSFFLGGTLGSLLGFIVPERTVYVSYANAEAAFMGVIDDAANHVLTWGIIGAFLGANIGLALARWTNQRADRLGGTAGLSSSESTAVPRLDKPAVPPNSQSVSDR